LVAARGAEALARERLNMFDEIHRRECRNVARLESQIARLDKNLEKLEARKTELQRVLALERETAEAVRLDEWVLVRHGAGENR
jgi:prefoldin subunit 5